MEALFTVAPFSRKSIVMGSFISQKTVSMTFYTDCFAWNVFFTRESVFPLYRLFFLTHGHCGQPMSCKDFLTKMYFSINITNSSVNFTWFALFSHQKFHSRVLFKLGALCLICHHFEMPENKYFFEIEIIFAMN